MGKSIALLASVLLSVMANAASAVEARDCEAQASRMKVAERAGFLTACLSGLGSPENVKQAVLRKKKGTCERNAKNLSLRDEFRSRYIGICVERNEAALAYAAANRHIFRISAGQLAVPETARPAPVASIPQKKPAKGRNGKLRTRQASAATCKEG